MITKIITVKEIKILIIFYISENENFKFFKFCLHKKFYGRYI